MLLWWTIGFSFLLLFTCLFSGVVGQQEFYKKLIKEKELYKASSQILLKYPTLEKDRKRLKGIFSTVNSKVDAKIETTVETEVETKIDYTGKILNERTKIETKVDTKVNTHVSNFLLVLDQLVFEITKTVRKIPQYFWDGKKDFNKDFFLPINYLHWLSFLLMYLFCVLIFRSTWVTYFFVTHRIIMQRLKRLNIDITNSTERENSISVNSGSAGSGIGTRTKKTHDVSDAREIEKELQDILSDMQRIPVIMCRPKVVIVFDELDKVEPGETGSEKENPQTKASLFFFYSTRERQTEILRILSNMKYFLSTARAKFVFIAGREMFDIHLADVSERNNYIGSIFNVVIYVPSFLTDHHTGEKSILQESSIASLPEEFVCRRLFPHDYVESYNLKNYRAYLEREVFYKDTQNIQQEKIQKIIAVLQQFIIYLAHVSKGAPKKMMQLFESFVEIRNERDKNREDDFLSVQCYHSSRHFLSFNYYNQYTLGIIAYLITPIFYRLAESNIKEHSDKLLVSSLRFVDFLFKFHKHSFSWKHLDISPEMLEVNRAPELKSIAVDLLNYLAQIHINKSTFSLSEYRFDGLIANEIFAMAKTDEVFSALFSFSLDETLPLKKHYQDLLEKTKKEYQNEKNSSEFIDAISSLQGVLGDLHYYADELEEAEAYYKSAVQALRKNENNRKMTFEQFYVYVRNMLRLGIIYEKRKQYDFAYLTYGELCKRIIRERDISICSPRTLYFKDISPNTNDMLFIKMTYEGLKMLYLPFIAKLQILEQSHVGGITRNHLKQLDKEFDFLTHIIDIEEAKLLEAEFYSRVADILYYKNSDLKCKKNKNRINDNDEDKCGEDSYDKEILPENSSCTACYYYHKALSILLNKPDYDKSELKDNNNNVIKLLYESGEQIKENYNMKFFTILARILSDWGNVFFSCDTKSKKDEYSKCYICDAMDCNTQKWNSLIANNLCDIIDCETNNLGAILKKIIKDYDFTKMKIVFAMYAISLHAYRKANLYKRASYQIYKMLCLFKYYEIYSSKELKDYNIEQLSKKAINYLWYANEDLNVPELNKRKKDFDRKSIKKTIPLQNLLVDSEITRIRILVKELELKSDLTSKKLEEYYGLYITSPHEINYSIVGRIYRLWLKSKVNYKTYRMLIHELTDLITEYNEGTGNKSVIKTKLDDFGAFYDKDKDKFIKVIRSEIKYILKEDACNKTVKEIFGKYFDIKEVKDVTEEKKIQILDNLIAETIYCLIDIAQLSETMDETYIFTHSFFGLTHKHLSFWIRVYEDYEKYRKEKPCIDKLSKIDGYLEKYLDEEWREQLSGYRENQRALSHYYKCLEMHNEGRAYHNRIDTMCYVKDDYNDRSDHFNIAEERHLIVNREIEKKINEIKDNYKDSKLYDVNSYF
jgi:hypothetical protein